MDDPAFEAALRAIAADRARGAAELGRAALSLLADAVQTLPAQNRSELRQRLQERANRVAGCRPSMAPVSNLVGQWLRGPDAPAGRDDEDVPTLRRRYRVWARELIERSELAGELAAANAAEYIGPGRTLLTHSRSATVLSVFRRLAGRGTSALVSESRPLNEGLVLARELAALGISVCLITDAQLGLAVGEADAVLIGADSLLPDGGVLNKCGTYPLALAANDHRVPFIVCCERFKRRPPQMGPPELEVMDPGELGYALPDGVTARNRYFDITPARLVTAWVDELGVHETYEPG